MYFGAWDTAANDYLWHRPKHTNMKTLDEVKAEAIRRGIGPGSQIVTPFQNKKSIPKSAKWSEFSGAFWLVYGGSNRTKYACVYTPTIDRWAKVLKPSSTIKQSTMTKRTNILYINVRKGKHKVQPWTWSIDKRGTNDIVTKGHERYVTKKSAIRGALRSLNLWDGRTTGPWNTVLGRKNYVVYTQIVTK